VLRGPVLSSAQWWDHCSG